MGRVRRERKSKVVKDPSADQSVTVTSKIEDGPFRYIGKN